MEKVAANDRMIFLTSIHPPVILGHKNCVQTPIKTPKHRGFMLNMEKYGVSAYSVINFLGRYTEYVLLK